jgi:anoctamin-1
MELVIQIGFVSIFAVAFPLGAILALINNVIELRTDGNKFVNILQRHPALSANGIGVWLTLMQVVGIISVITNVAIVVFVSSQIKVMGMRNKE